MPWTSIQDFIDICNNRLLPEHCVICSCDMRKMETFNYAPAIISVMVSWTSTPADCTICLNINDNVIQYNLCGIIYYRDNHFTSRYIDKNQAVWFNDGIQQGHNCVAEGSIETVNLQQGPEDRDTEIYLYTIQH